MLVFEYIRIRAIVFILINATLRMENSFIRTFIIHHRLSQGIILLNLHTVDKNRSHCAVHLFTVYRFTVQSCDSVISF